MTLMPVNSTITYVLNSAESYTDTFDTDLSTGSTIGEGEET